MRCSLCELQLAALLDDALPPAERAEMLVHLEGCERCRAILDELRCVDALLLMPRRIVPKDTFTNRIMEGVGTLAPPRVARPSATGILVTYLVFAWVIIGAWWFIAGRSAGETFAWAGSALGGYGAALTSLSTATTELFGTETSGVTAVLSAIVAVDAVAAVALGIAYAASRPRFAKRLARLSENL